LRRDISDKDEEKVGIDKVGVDLEDIDAEM